MVLNHPFNLILKKKFIFLMITIIISGICAIGITFGETYGPKYLVLIVISISLLLIFEIIPNKKEFVLSLFLFTIGSQFNVHLLHSDMSFNMFNEEIFRPVHGYAIYLPDGFLVLLVIIWLKEMITTGTWKIYKGESVLLLMLIVFILTIPGIVMSSNPLPVKIGLFFGISKCILVFMYLTNNMKSLRLLKFSSVIIAISLMMFGSLQIIQIVNGGIGIGSSITGEQELKNQRTTNTQGKIIKRASVGASPTHAAAYIGFNLPILVALLFTKIKNHYKVIIISIIGICAIADILTFSRGGWISLLFGCMFVLIHCFGNYLRSKLIASVAVVAALLILAASIFILSTQVQDRIIGNDAGGLNARLPMIVLALNVIKSNIFMGVGFGDYSNVATKYDFSSDLISYFFPYPVHSEYLLILAEQGIFVFIIFMGILIISFKKFNKVWRENKGMFIGNFSLGIMGGLLTWSIHHLVEYEYVFLKPGWWGILAMGYAAYFLNKKSKKNRLSINEQRCNC